MLWTLLTCVSSVTFVAMPVVVARELGAGVGGFLTVTLVGVALGISNSWCVAKFAHAAQDRLLSHAEAIPERVLRIVYLGAAVWTFGAAAASHWITSRILSLLG